MSNYRILIVLTPPFDPNTGGVQMSTFKMASYFSSKGHQVSVFSFEKEGHIDPNFASLYHANEGNRHLNPVNIMYMKEVVHKERPSVVINQMPYETAIGDALAACKQDTNFLLLGCLRNTLFSVVNNIDTYRKRVLPAPLQSSFANSIGRKILLKGHKWKHARDLKFILNTYDYFVMFGPPNQKELKYFVGDYKNEKTAYAPNSIPQVLKEVPQKEKVILYLGRLNNEQKRSDLILPLWKKLRNDLSDWRLEVVGGGPELQKIKTQIEKENLPRVKVFGKQKPDEYYRRAAIFFMTSAYEGFPNTLVEAQSFGSVPIIFDSYSIAGWMVNEAKDAFLVPPFDTNVMAERIKCLAKQDEVRIEMAKASLENARRFTIDKVGQSWLNLFEEKMAQIND